MFDVLGMTTSRVHYEPGAVATGAKHSYARKNAFSLIEFDRRTAAVLYDSLLFPTTTLVLSRTRLGQLRPDPYSFSFGTHSWK